MSLLYVPESFELRTAPELGPLALLDVALVVADQALRLEHAQLDDIFRDRDHERPPDTLVAALLTQRFRELRSLVAFYSAAARHTHIPDRLPF